jgi:tRNA(fMet)-specific endonuclease VapC
MKLYILDTDISGLLQQEHSSVIARIRDLSDEDTIATTIITVGEDLGGWLPACRRAANGAARAVAYARLQHGLEFYREIVWFPFDQSAAEVFDKLRAEYKRLGTNDLALAAITISLNGVLITRNTVDFQRISGLVLEDWLG